MHSEPKVARPPSKIDAARGGRGWRRIVLSAPSHTAGRWKPDPSLVQRSHLGRMMADLGCGFEALQRWSVQQPEAYWGRVIEGLGVRFATSPKRILSHDDQGRAVWLPGATMNIVASCFEGRDPDGLALVRGWADGRVERWSLAELKGRAARVAQGLIAQGFKAGDAVAIDMPMTAHSVAIYLGIVWMGGVVVSIADSFAPDEIRTRLRISHAKAIFTQDVILRGAKTLPLFERVCAADAPCAIVVPAAQDLTVTLRPGDLAWDEFLAAAQGGEPAYQLADAAASTNILFSSGTTGEPKAIPWTQTTPIKAAGDAWAHHDVHEGEILAWPTNLGWMMGPWLIYAALLNGAAVALFEGSPLGAPFARFIQDAKITMLGVVPSLVKAWRHGEVLAGLDWSGVRRFSSTGEASTAAEMSWLMAQAGGAPVLEYCGGTEIGGGYLCGSMVQEQRAGLFSSPAMGCGLYLLSEEGEPSGAGEVALVAPLFGASQRLLNQDHDSVYFAGMPKGPKGEQLRRHGDFMECLEGGFYRAHGRVDDTMNLGGIKVSSAEIERVVNRLDGVHESAAVAVQPVGGGPSELVLVVVPQGAMDVGHMLTQAQAAIRRELNPLFKVVRVQGVEQLPRTASNKVMRRVLRARLEA